MNRTILRISLTLLLLAVLLTASACRREAPAQVAVETTSETTQPPETEAPETDPTEAPDKPTEAQPETFLLTFAGDCTFGSTPNNYFADCGFIKTVGEDYGYPFRNVLQYFQNDDFTMVNLEGPLCDSGNPVLKKHTFRGPTAYTAILTDNSVEAVTIANNHTMDYGQLGYDSTLAALDSAGVPYVQRDASRLITTEAGLTIGLYGMVYYELDVADMQAEIAALKQQGAELVIVAPHWGTEGSYRSASAQTEVGYAAIDAGANIVFGSHPHVLQPIEEYNGGIIYYSLGNFSFGGNAYPGDYDTALLQQEVIRQTDGTVTLGELTRIPACVSSVSGLNNFQPTPYEVGTEDYDRVLQKLDGTFTGPNLKIQ